MAVSVQCREYAGDELDVKKTCKPVAAGVLDIISGSLGILCAVLLVIPIVILEVLDERLAGHILITIAVICAITCALAIIGGAFALRRKFWGLALAGSIAALIPIPIFGITAVILTALSKDEFE